MKVLFCLPGGGFSSTWIQAWTWTLTTLHQEGIEYSLSNTTGSEIAALRNKVAGGATALGEFQRPFPDHDHDVTFWIDSDMVWTPDDVLRLLGHDMPIVSGLYANGRGEPNAFTDRSTRVEPGDGLEQVYATGFGFIKVDRDVYEHIPYPWFRLMPSETGGTDSEDVSFCRLARAAGFEVWLDKGVHVGHEKPCIVKVGGVVSVY